MHCGRAKDLLDFDGACRLVPGSRPTSAKMVVLGVIAFHGGSPEHLTGVRSFVKQVRSGFSVGCVASAQR